MDLSRRVVPVRGLFFQGMTNDPAAVSSASSGGGSPDASAQDVSPSSNKKASTPTSTRGGGGTPTGGSGGGRRLSGGDGSKHGEDTNRHKGKESAIFSPALRSESHDEVCEGSGWGEMVRVCVVMCCTRVPVGRTMSMHAFCFFHV